MTTCITLSSAPTPLAAPVTGSRSTTETNCIGVGLTLDQLKAYWADTTNNCNREFNSIIYSGVNPPGSNGAPIRQFSPNGFRQVSDDMQYLLTNFFNSTPTGHTVSTPGSPGYDTFQQTLVDACTNPEYNNQGSCQEALVLMCQGCNRTTILNNADTLKLCGCNVPGLDAKVYPDIPRECDPVCAQAIISKRRDPQSGIVAECNSPVCVIDNISIVSARSTIGGISFTQICPQCTGGQPCRCIVDASVPNLSAIGLDTTTEFRQSCGAGSVCLTIDPQTGASTNVPCSSAVTPMEPKTYFYEVPLWVWILAIIIVIVGCLAALAALYGYQHDPHTIPRVSISR